MAEIRLRAHEVGEDLLPATCACCGDDASDRKTKNFAWHPQWLVVLVLVGVLIYALVAMIMTKRMIVSVPLCQRHRNHFLVRGLLTYGGLGLLCLIAFLGIALLIGADRASGEMLGGLVCGGGAVLALVWIITVAVLQHIGIRPVEITDRSITLTNVSEDFAAAVLDERDRRREEDEVARHWKPRADRPRERDRRVSEDEEPPRRRRSKEDDENFYEPEDRE